MHVDHYAELTAAHRGDVPIYTSPATATILDDVFDVATNKYDITASEAVTSAITELMTGQMLFPTSKSIQCQQVMYREQSGSCSE